MLQNNCIEWCSQNDWIDREPFTCILEYDMMLWELTMTKILEKIMSIIKQRAVSMQSEGIAWPETLGCIKIKINMHCSYHRTRSLANILSCGMPVSLGNREKAFLFNLVHQRQDKQETNKKWKQGYSGLEAKTNIKTLLHSGCVNFPRWYLWDENGIIEFNWRVSFQQWCPFEFLFIFLVVPCFDDHKMAFFSDLTIGHCSSPVVVAVSSLGYLEYLGLESLFSRNIFFLQTMCGFHCFNWNSSDRIYTRKNDVSLLYFQQTNLISIMALSYVQYST